MNDRFNVIDLADPAQPALRGSLAMGRQSLASSGNLACLTGPINDCALVDAANSAKPVLKGSVKPSRWPALNDAEIL